MARLERLSEGMAIVYGGDRVAHVSADLANAFRPGDRLIVDAATGELLLIPATEWEVASGAVDAAADAFARMGEVSDDQITDFYRSFARLLEDDDAFAPIATANQSDVERSRAAGRSTTRLVLGESMRAGMIDGLMAWADLPPGRGSLLDTVEHDGWRVDLLRAGLGVVGFVFEGRPNVFADATGVLRSGNTVVFRIGSAALETARAIVANALHPALQGAGLPVGAVSLVDSASRAAGWAMFADDRLSLAVARGSGGAVAQLGGIARAVGTPVSLHGTGGAWIMASGHADPEAFRGAVVNSLDRKVCNTLNTCCITADAADRLVPVFLDALEEAGRRRRATSKLHVADGDEGRIPAPWFEPAPIHRAGGVVEEPRTEVIGRDRMGVEWEWEDSPEVTLAVVADVDDAVGLFNDQSPRFVASLVSQDSAEQQRFWDTIDAPFVGNGFTRWVDGQYALGRPELGLSNWQYGRLFGRPGILSGDSVFSVRIRMEQDDPDQGR